MFVPGSEDAAGDQPIGTSSGYCMSIQTDDPLAPARGTNSIAIPVSYISSSAFPAAGTTSDLASGSPSATYDPVTPAEQKMFQEMYGDVGLDAETMKTLTDAWTNSTAVKRKSDYDNFMASLHQVAGDATSIADSQASEPSKSNPVTPAEQNFVPEMYGNLGLDAETMKTLTDAWTNSTAAKRKSDYDTFMASLHQAAGDATRQVSGSAATNVEATPQTVASVGVQGQEKMSGAIRRDDFYQRRRPTHPLSAHRQHL